MKTDVSMFECEILRLGTNEKLGTIHCMAYNLFHCSHEVMEYISSNECKFTGLIEIGSIRKLSDIQTIINPYFLLESDDEDEMEDEDDLLLPYRVVENLPDSDQRVMKFKCQCKEELRVSSGDWNALKCTNCGNIIFRGEVENIGNMYVYLKKSK